MTKVLIVSAVLVVCIANTTALRYNILPTDGKLISSFPTYRPPVSRRPVIRTARQINVEPQLLWKGENIERAPSTADHPILPSLIDDDKLNPNRRYTRSKDSPSAKSYGGGSSSSGNRNTGPTHPGYNRRNTRSIRAPDLDFDPLRPFVPGLPSPYDPFGPQPRPRGPYPIYTRTVRDVQFPGMKKPTYRDVIIPNWNPNVRTSPWDSLGGRRKTRSLGNPGKEDEIYQDYYDVLQ